MTSTAVVTSTFAAGTRRRASAHTAAVVAPRRTPAPVRRALLEEGLRVVRVGAPDELRSLAKQPAVVVALHPGQGSEPATAVRDIRLAAPTASLVVVTRELGLRTLRELLAAGADAVVLEQDAEHVLGPAVRGARLGLLSFPASIRPSLVRPALSTREKQVLGMVVLGMSNGEIARKLHLAESTVKTHLRSSFGKLGVRSRNEAAQLILDPDAGLGSGILTIGDGS